MRGQRQMSAGRSRNAGRCTLTTFRRKYKIFAETLGFDLFLQIAVRGGDQADIDLDRLRAADAVDLAFLNGAQQFCLQTHIHFADFIQ